ncbi:hypothetical protein HOP50_20g85040 [Chloropicon primus]|uniref:lysozyme n=1 Tax=Chloropicon primus TaxID=1764295 RepID=A0A5B8N265_9CHLO|nr:hypothetical protein A3770_20p84730 [Chloropicon primus]UPR05156.1 hypothetical protein HOP50_20g85040 [Chloropicon primus]|eukprot:QDZ25955.1 hypothetical protein A3770_20p84730 [Chloropicon primus]
MGEGLEPQEQQQHPCCSGGAPPPLRKPAGRLSAELGGRSMSLGTLVRRLHGIQSVYRVRRGDTLFSMAGRLGLPLSDLVRANGGKHWIREGMTFHLPFDFGERECDRDRDQVWGAFRVGGGGLEGKRLKLRNLLRAIRHVETGSCPLPAPSGDGGKSVGPLQIGYQYFCDAWGTGESEVRWKTKCQNLEFSEDTAIRYWSRWCPWALQFLDLEALARAHNGGPRYTMQLKTARYWRKVRESLGEGEDGKDSAVGKQDWAWPRPSPPSTATKLFEIELYTF